MLAANPSKLSTVELETLWHTIGMTSRNYRRCDRWWANNDNHRNYYAAEPSGQQAWDREINSLVERGYMTRGREIPGGLVYYHATEAGIRAAKTEFAATRKAAKIKGV